MPIEHELMSVSPAQEDTPACQARRDFRHQLHDVAVLQHDVVRGDFAERIAEMIDRALVVPHAGVVQQDHVGDAAASRSPWFGDGLTSATTQESARNSDTGMTGAIHLHCDGWLRSAHPDGTRDCAETPMSRQGAGSGGMRAGANSAHCGCQAISPPRFTACGQAGRLWARKSERPAPAFCRPGRSTRTVWS